jgi:hypothetical protein
MSVMVLDSGNSIIKEKLPGVNREKSLSHIHKED